VERIPWNEMASTQLTAIERLLTDFTSSFRLDSLSFLSDSAPSSTPYQAPSPQQTFESETSDLCSLSSLLVVSVPGLHFSDLARLPEASSSPTGFEAGLLSSQSLITQPYVREHTLSKPLKLVRRFERECGAVFESQQEKNLWSGDKDAKTIRIVQIDGLQEWELVGTAAAEGRKQVLETAGMLSFIRSPSFSSVLTSSVSTDSAVSYHRSNMASPHAVILTALPASYSSPRKLNTKRPDLHLKQNMKRQLLEPETTGLPADEQEFMDEVLEEIKEEQAFDAMINKIDTKEASTSDIGVSDIVDPESIVSESVVEDLDESEELPIAKWNGEVMDNEEWDGEMLEVSPYSTGYEAYQKGAKDGKGKKNGTSIFEPKEKSGLLHRYVFFTPALVFGALPSLLTHSLTPTSADLVSQRSSSRYVNGLDPYRFDRGSSLDLDRNSSWIGDQDDWNCWDRS